MDDYIDANHYDTHSDSAPGPLTTDATLSAYGSSSRFRFTTDGTTAGITITFDLLFTDRYGNQWNDSFNVPVN